MKIAICGNMGVGKTSLLAKMTENRFFHFSEPTIGAGFHSLRIGDGRTAEIWDTSGQERYRSLVKMYFRNATVVIVVYDVHDRQSFEDVVSYWIRVACEHVQGPHIYLIGSKADQPSDQQRVVSYDEGARLAANHKLCGFAELSAKTSTVGDIKAVFDGIYQTFAHEVENRGDRTPLVCIGSPVTEQNRRRCC